MKFIAAVLLLSLACLSLCSCTMFYDKPPTADSGVQATPKPLTIPVGKNWQVTEEAPQLSNDSGRLPFQTEQSLQPGIAKPVAPVENRTIETSH